MKRLWLFFGVCFLLQIALIAVPRADGHLIGGDGLYYFAYLRSLCLDGDLNIVNEIAFHNQGLPTLKSEVDVVMRDIPQMTYAFAVGTSLLWAPFFLLGHGLVLLLSALGIDIVLNGYSYIEEALVCLGSLFYGCIGMWLTFKLLCNYVSERVASTATLITVVGTSTFYYLVFEPTMSHAVSFFVCALFFYILPIHNVSATKLGAIVGVMTLVRWQNIVFTLALLPLRPFQRGPARAIIMALLVFLPQIIFWKITLGSWLIIPQGADFVDFWHPQFGAVLFSLQHGLISWTPLVAICLMGLVRLFRKQPQEALAFLLAFLAMLYVNASVVADIGGGAAFGMRRFVNCTPIFALGLAMVLQWAKQTWFFGVGQRTVRWALYSVITLLLCWNALFMVQYRLHFIDPIAPISWHEMTRGKFNMFFEIQQKIKARFVTLP